MKLFNIGIPELIFVLIIMLIFVGPEGMQDSARKLARLVRMVVRSQTWRTFTSVYNEVKEYPAQVLKEVELEELSKELKNEVREINQTVQKEIQEGENEVNTVLAEQQKELNAINSDLALTGKDIRNTDLLAEDIAVMTDTEVTEPTAESVTEEEKTNE